VCGVLPSHLPKEGVPLPHHTETAISVGSHEKFRDLNFHPVLKTIFKLKVLMVFFYNLKVFGLGRDNSFQKLFILKI
jgi:hypothetical protein